MSTTQIQNIKLGYMKTVDFELKIKGMRKFQKFIVYPITDAEEPIKIQSNTRMGSLNLKTGIGNMSKSHSSGAYFHHLQLDPLTEFVLTEVDLSTLRMKIFTTGSKKGGNSVMSFDNSGASKVLD